MGEWLKFFINHHHEKVNSQELADLSTTEREIAPALQVLETVIRYQELCRDRENKDKELSVLQAEAQRGEWDPKVVAALLQLRQDETFIQELNAGQ